MRKKLTLGESRSGVAFYSTSKSIACTSTQISKVYRCWSNYLGRQPQLPPSSIAVPKFDVFPSEEADTWAPYVDSGVSQAHAQPSRLRTVALQITSLCEISSDLLLYFYHPNNIEKPMGKQTELKKLSKLHTRLEAWRKGLPKELEAREGQLPSALVMQ